MRKLYFLVMLTLFTAGLNAQQSLLVFMEASEKRPFYLKIGMKTHASSSTGQVYITELPDSNYEIQVGFPETDIPEHRFLVALRKNDNNFQLKNSAQGWTLIDLESNQTLQPLLQTAKTSYAIGGVRKTDAFSIMMAGVVNDTSVLYTSVAPPAPPKEEVAKAVPTVSSNSAASLPGNSAVGIPAVSASAVDNTQAGRQPIAAAENAAKQSSPPKAVGTISSGTVDSATVNTADKTVVANGKEVKAVTDSGLATSVVVSRGDSVKVLAANEQLRPDRDAEDRAIKDRAIKDQAIKDQAIKDQAIKDQAAKDELAKVEAMKEQAAKDQAVKDQLARDQATKDQAARDKVEQNQSAKDPSAVNISVRKLSENKNDKQVSLKYADVAVAGKTDTIEVIIPIEPGATPTPRKESAPVKYSPNERPLRDPVTIPVAVGDTAKSRGNAGEQKSTVSPASTGPVMINSDCVNFATEYDVDKLRVKMVNEVTADDRVAAARKVFRTKCFTSRQIRALTELFLNDEGKYKFLDAAYPFVSDSQEFRNLIDVLKEDYYVKRFNAMIRG